MVPQCPRKWINFAKIQQLFPFAKDVDMSVEKRVKTTEKTKKTRNYRLFSVENYVESVEYPIISKSFLRMKMTNHV